MTKASTSDTLMSVGLLREEIEMKFVDKVFERVARGGVFERVVAIPHGEGGEVRIEARIWGMPR